MARFQPTFADREKGFTLVEMTLSIALLLLVAGLGLPLFRQQFVRNDLRVAEDQTLQALYRARGLAAAGEDDDDWGVHIESGVVTVFLGDNYTGRDTNYDEQIELNPEIGLSGDLEVVFMQNTGEPDVVTTFSYMLLGAGEVEISINETGLVSVVRTYD